jgi:hypothetical protein
MTTAASTISVGEITHEGARCMSRRVRSRRSAGFTLTMVDTSRRDLEHACRPIEDHRGRNSAVINIKVGSMPGAAFTDPDHIRVAALHAFKTSTDSGDALCR